MKAFIALTLLCVASATEIKELKPFAFPYTGYTGFAGYPYLSGYAPYHAGYAPYHAGYAPYHAGYTGYAGYAGYPYLGLPAPSKQYAAGDEFGNFNYGYANLNSAKHEAGNAYGGVTGSYSYVDADGELQTTSYIADALGFRVKSTNLPVAPVADLKQPVFDLVGPAPVEDTEEVKAAKAEFQKAFDEAAAREKRSTPADTEALEAPEEPEKLILPAYNYGAYPYAYGAYPYSYGAYPYSYGAYPHSYGYGFNRFFPY